MSPLGIIRKEEPNSFRPIHHLFPKGTSLNDEIDASMSSVSYCTFEDAIQQIRRFGKSVLLTKVDIKAAFRLLLIDPLAFNSLDMYFQRQLLFRYVPP